MKFVTGATWDEIAKKAVKEVTEASNRVFPQLNLEQLTLDISALRTQYGLEQIYFEECKKDYREQMMEVVRLKRLLASSKLLRRRLSSSRHLGKSVLPINEMTSVVNIISDKIQPAIETEKLLRSRMIKREITNDIYVRKAEIIFKKHFGLRTSRNAEGPFALFCDAIFKSMKSEDDRSGEHTIIRSITKATVAKTVAARRQRGGAPLFAPPAHGAGKT